MSASDASGGAMIRIGSPESRTSTKTTTDTTNIDAMDCSNRPKMYRCTLVSLVEQVNLAAPRRSSTGRRDQLVIRLRRHVGKRRPSADLLRHRPCERLHAEHHTVVAIVELLPEVPRQLRPALAVELAHGGVYLLVEGAVDEQIERGLRVHDALPRRDRLVERRRAIDGEPLVGLAQARLGPEAAGRLGDPLDLDAELLPVERHRL